MLISDTHHQKQERNTGHHFLPITHQAQQSRNGASALPNAVSPFFYSAAPAMLANSSCILTQKITNVSHARIRMLGDKGNEKVGAGRLVQLDERCQK